MIMPAFGALTGGLDVQDVAIITACDLICSEVAEALVATRTGYVRFALNGGGAFAK
jgi:metallophosphoesterase superfamily enzyme